MDRPDQHAALERASRASLTAAWEAVRYEQQPIADSAMLNVASLILEIALQANADLASAAINELWAAHRLPWRLVQTH